MASAQPFDFRRKSPDGDLHGAPPAFDWDAATVKRRGRLRLRTLVLLRWLAVVGQLIAVLTTTFWLHIAIPLTACLVVIGASAFLNAALTVMLPRRHLALDWEAAAQLAFDIVQLTILLGLTGGLDNPFCLLLIAPTTVAAATLPTKQAFWIMGLAMLAASTLALVDTPLLLIAGHPLHQPWLYRTGVWVGTEVGIAFTSGYSWLAAEEGARMELALAATQSVLAREQRLSALGGLAAAAAHELGTPLATIQVVAKELLRNSPPDDPVAEDARLLLQQSQRCREILKSLGQHPDTDDAVHARLHLSQLLEEVTEPYRQIGPAILTEVQAPPGEFIPEVKRLPEAIHALSSFVENAADFALDQVWVTGSFDDDTISVEIRDDGPGFAPEVLAKLGEPYVTSRPGGEGSRSNHEGMGLGFFIAKTLLERTGASVTFGNDRRGGAVILSKWPRQRIEAPDQA
jgi:two-component system sensor histidine kinase RegB